ncbi:MAG: class C beta-lactamase-related serine hydrolase [Clostridia bacterium]|nr:class C beta-lactamase-related serine hydrolase [Clostridia bacterium]
MIMILKKALMPLLLLVLITIINACHVGRFFYWNFADADDYKKFAAAHVAADSVNFEFQKATKPCVPQIPSLWQQEDSTDDFTGFLRKNHTLAFLIIRNDTILYEQYFDGTDSSSIMPSFSVSKSFVSALVGIAIGDGFIKSVDQPVTNFIPELLDNDTAFRQITIDDLLNMRSGVRFNEGYLSPFADMAKYYYGTNLQRYILKLKIDRPPDEVYNYQSVNTLLLGMALERATGTPLNEYLSQKIWKPLGMSTDVGWSIDSERHGTIKAFCCLDAPARDFARFGRLYLNNGQWQGNQVVPETWVKETMQIVNDSRDGQGYSYTRHWRVKTDGAIFAKGLLGQYIYIDPHRNLLMLRFGTKATDIVWPDLMEKVAREL